MSWGRTYRYPVPGWLLVAVLALPFVVAIALLVGMAMYPHRSQQLVQKVASRLPQGIGSALERLMERFLEGLAVLRSPQRLVRVFLLSLPVWADGRSHVLRPLPWPSISRGSLRL